MKGDEIDERNFHALTNICELNMGEEPEKFFWGAFARGLSKAAGPRGLAKLSRWDDRSKIHLSSTLLPYLTALLDEGKIEPDLALALNHLANPVEYYRNGTTEFAKAIQNKIGTTKPKIVLELIKQFEDNNPGFHTHSTVEVLASLARETLGSGSETAAYLSAAQRHLAKLRKTSNDHSNIGESDPQLRKRVMDQDRRTRATLRAIARNTDPIDQASLADAINGLNELQHVWDLRDNFFASLRRKVSFKRRAQYLRNICGLEHLNFYWKLTELKVCKDKWENSSITLGQILKDTAIPLIRLHASDLVDGGRLSGSQLKEISDLTSVPVTDLVLELVTIYARPDTSLPGAVWLAFASFICPEAEEGQGQVALRRMLESEAARLADKVVDGTWTTGLYPTDNMEIVAAGFVWRMLGSPHAEDRWRASHTIRSLARFGRWKVIDALVGKLRDKTAGPFQARELAFYYMHAQLWLLIALARIALDHPAEVGSYSDQLISFATPELQPHVLMRHFASRALLACNNLGSLKLSPNLVKELESSDHSPYPRMHKKIRTGGGFYQGRPKALPKPKFEFYLDYDFHKYDVDNLSQIFGKPCWEVTDLISEIVHEHDQNISGMHDADGRTSRYQHLAGGVSNRYHTYGEQLGWHGLFLAAGKLLAKFPVTEDWHYEEDPWGEWLGRYGLTRRDGLWLSDGTDRMPLDTAHILMEKGPNGPVLTGDRNKLLQLVGVTSRIGKQLVIHGSWHSADNIVVRVSSALVAPGKASHLASDLTREEPMIVWVPTYHQGEENIEYQRDKKEYIPWIVQPSGDARLDENDPYGVAVANFRPRLFKDYASTLSLTTADPFGRQWKTKQGVTTLRAQAWGREDKSDESRSRSGMRLYCSASSLERLLREHDKSLLLLILLQRREKKWDAECTYIHTVAVASISKNLGLKYFKGRINNLYRSPL